jgi:hypothetical protein
MGMQRALRKFRRIGSGTLRWLWIAVLLPLVAFLIEIIKWIWGEWASRIFGDEAVELMEGIFTTIARWFPLALQWVFNHPAEASIIWFFLVLSIITMRVYWGTRDPKGIRAFAESTLTKDKGFVVSNDSGSDLYECTVSLREINKRQVEHKNLEWGTAGNPLDETLTIKHTDKAPVFLGRAYSSIESVTTQDQLAGKHQLELMFHGNRHHHEVVSMPIYITVRMQIEAGTRSLFVENVET